MPGTARARHPAHVVQDVGTRGRQHHHPGGRGFAIVERKRQARGAAQN
jgi:hypothetical protein